MLDRWGEMLESGDSAGALEMLGQRLPELPDGDNLEDYLSKVLLSHRRLWSVAHVCKAFHSHIRCKCCRHVNVLCLTA